MKIGPGRNSNSISHLCRTYKDPELIFAFTPVLFPHFLCSGSIMTWMRFCMALAMAGCATA